VVWYLSDAGCLSQGYGNKAARKPTQDNVSCQRLLVGEGGGMEVTDRSVSSSSYRSVPQAEFSCGVSAPLLRRSCSDDAMKDGQTAHGPWERGEAVDVVMP
jgi:hypothetical protein